MLTIHVHQAPRLRMIRATFLVPCMLSWRGQEKLLFCEFTFIWGLQILVVQIFILMLYIRSGICFLELVLYIESADFWEFFLNKRCFKILCDENRNHSIFYVTSSAAIG